jgi:hypothetical protein
MPDARPHRIAVHLDQVTKQRVVAHATDERRSVSNTAEVLLVLALELVGRRRLTDVLLERGGAGRVRPRPAPRPHGR